MVRILPSITTGALTDSNWRDKLEEVVRLRIERVALFPTWIGDEERQELFAALIEAKKRFRFSIPFVHATATMQEEEYTFLEREFQTELFNLHSERQLPLRHQLSRRRKQQIFVENTNPQLFHDQDLEMYAGICFDLSHLNDHRTESPLEYDRIVQLAQNYLIGANHVSAIDSLTGRSKHILSDRSELDYLAELPGEVWATTIAIELENSIAEQLELIPLIELHHRYAQTILKAA